MSVYFSDIFATINFIKTMPCSHHSSFSRSILVVIFLFLNGICIASPAVVNPTNNYHTQSAALPFGNDLNNVETGENQLPVQSCKQQAALRSVVPASGAGLQAQGLHTADHRRDFGDVAIGR